MSAPPTALLAARASRARESLAKAGCDALVVSNLRNIRYLSNFDGTTALLLVTAARLYLLSDFRYSAAVLSLLASPGAPPDTEFLRVEGSYDEALACLVARECVGGRVGFESAHMSVKQHVWLSDRLARDASAPPQLVPTDGLVEGARAVKDAWELDTLRTAGRRLSAAARGILSESVRPGRTERDIAIEVDRRLTDAGFERTAFDTIVAAGPTSAMPHARPGDRLVGENDVVLLDFGGVYRGYAVDLTRTVAVGTPPPDVARVYSAVHRAQQAAIAAVRPGVAPDAVDAAARESLAIDGLAEVFGHGTGHGLGLDIHEEPRLGKRRDDAPSAPPLAAGMVCTIEPGAYLTDAFGVRLEDDIIVTDAGAELITDVPFDARLLDAR